MSKKETKQETEVLQPEIVNETQSTINLKRGECLVRVLSGNDKGAEFVTSIVSAEKYYSNESKFEIVKKNQ